MTFSAQNQPTTDQILNSAEFKELVSERRKLWIPIVVTIISTYFGFILLVAFAPAILGKTIGDGKVSIGIYAGLGLLLLSFLLTAIYLRLSDGKINVLQQKIRAKFQ